MVSTDKWRDVRGVQELTSSLLLREEVNVPTGGESWDCGGSVWAKHSQIFGTRLPMGKSRSSATVRAGPS